MNRTMTMKFIVTKTLQNGFEMEKEVLIGVIEFVKIFVNEMLCCHGIKVYESISVSPCIVKTGNKKLFLA